MQPFAERFGSGLWLAVVIATYNRTERLRRLLEQLDEQTIDPSHYEVVAIDDGGKEDARAALSDLKTRYALRIERQGNAGAAAARQRGVDLARAPVIVVVDDDMQVKPTFLERHLARHEDDRTVVLGRLRPDAQLAEMPLFERFYARVLANKSDAFAAGKEKVRGHDVYTGNVSFPRKLVLDAGGFDTEFRALEDEELGVRFEKAGARFVFANDAESIHGSDWTSMRKWMDRAYRDGVYQTKVARKHPDYLESSPWRHLPNLNPVSRPFMALSLAAPSVTSLIANAAIRTAAAFDKIGLEPVAIAGATFVYGVQFYRGVRSETGSVLDVAREYGEFKRGVALLRQGEAGHSSAWRELALGIREDHRMIRFYADKYDARGKEDGDVASAAGRVGDGSGGAGSGDAAGGGGAGRGDSAGGSGAFGFALAGDAVKKIGFQLMIAYRVMRFFRQAGLGLGAQFMSRSIRHMFASDIHWDAELEPGVVIVHGFGLAISYAARVRSGCILFQNVTLGYGPDPETKQGGAPLLERNVHVGIGATLYGPIVVGEGTKIMAGCVLNRTVPPRSIVEAPVPQVATRGAPRGPRKGG